MRIRGILNSFHAVLLVFAGFFALSGQAAAAEPFTMERFEALQQEGARILVDVYAPWCPDCRRQQEHLDAYQQAYPDSGLHILTVDFDNQKDYVTHFRAPRQSTLILFEGEEQVWFSVAETRREPIFNALNGNY